MNVLEVKRDQLEEMIGEVVSWDYVPQQREKENIFVVYIFEDIPVKIKSKLTQEEFAKLCGDDIY